MSGSDETVSLKSLYMSLTNEVDEFMAIPKLLRDTYTQALDRISASEIANSDKTVARNARDTLKNISDQSLRTNSTKYFEKLYEQTIVLLVSDAEYLLREVFSLLIEKTFDKSKLLGKRVSFSLEDIVKLGFPIEKEKLGEKVLEHVLEVRNPDEKISFQNIQSITQAFKSYFSLDICVSEELKKSLHKFFQIRHVLLHQHGIADLRFIHNLDTVQVQHSYSVNKTVSVQEKDYKECKQTFIKFFEQLDLSFIARAKNGA
jgi:hypothetical protein